MTGEIRTDPGMKLFDLFFCIFMSYIAVWSGGLFWLLIALYLWFGAIVAKEFWPNLTDEQIAEIRRREWMEKRSLYDGENSDLREGPPEDTDSD